MGAAHVSARDKALTAALGRVRIRSEYLGSNGVKSTCINENGAHVELLDEVDQCRLAIGKLIDAGEPVAVDYEGVDLCRNGVRCVAQIAPREGATLLVDVETLGESAFGEGRFRELLESSDVLKLWYDCRADASALFHLHKTRPVNIWDVQVAYCRKRDKESYVKGLLREGLTFQERTRLDKVKLNGVKLSAPEKGGRYTVWRSRPLDPALVTYCAADVQYLHSMRDTWSHFVGDDEMAIITEKRVDSAINDRQPSKGKHKAIKGFP